MALFCPSFIRKQDDASGPIWGKTDLSYGLVRHVLVENKWKLVSSEGPKLLKKSKRG